MSTNTDIYICIYMIYSMLSIVRIYIFLYIRICLQVSTSVYREGDTDATANLRSDSLYTRSEFLEICYALNAEHMYSNPRSRFSTH